MKVLECSSKGDKRFSAFYARVSVFGAEATIEHHYQNAKRFSGVQLTVDMLTPWYNLLWLLYLDANPDLVEYAKGFDEFNDIFRGKNTVNCQADAIRTYIKKGRMSLWFSCAHLVKDLGGWDAVRGIKKKQLNQDKIAKAVAFTGHRPSKLQGGYDPNSAPNKALLKVLRGEILNAIAAGKEFFISGMALGIDMWAAEIVLDLRDNHGYDNLKLICAVPCAKQWRKWQRESRKEWQSIIDRADHVTYVSKEEYTDRCMQDRNEWMMDRASLVIAVYDGTRGGTRNAFDYAQQIGRSIVQIHPHTLETQFHL